MKKFSRIILFSALPVLALAVFLFLRQPVFGKHVRVERGGIKEFVSAPGKIASSEEAKLSFQTVGKIVYLAREGDQVKKDDRVAGLDATELSLSLNRYLSDLRQAEAERAYTYDQVKGHSTDETFAQRQTRTQAEVKYDKAVENVASARKALKDFSLYAPFDGEIVEVNGEIGEWVSPYLGHSQVRLINFSGTHFDSEVDQENVSLLRIGQKVLLRLDTFPDKEFQGEIYYISKATSMTEDGDPVVIAKIALSDLPQNTTIGLKGDSEIIVQEKEGVLLIPKSSVFRKGGKAFVHSDLGEKEVTLGIFDGMNWEVLGGLKEGDKVLW